MALGGVSTVAISNMSRPPALVTSLTASVAKRFARPRLVLDEATFPWNNRPPIATFLPLNLTTHHPYYILPLPLPLPNITTHEYHEKHSKAHTHSPRPITITSTMSATQGQKRQNEEAAGEPQAKRVR
jgi:hypothetical protein